MNKQAAVREFMVKAQQATPDYVTEPDLSTRKLRIRLIAEELAEFAAASGIDMKITMVGDSKVETIDNFGTPRPHGQYEACIEAADALADLLVVVYGGAVAWGTNIDPVFEEVMRSNMTKFIDGHERADGKWIKGPSYEPAKVREVLMQQAAPHG
jgi:predicted HAD superfamily Cof-like phosphohydrolase